MRCSLNQGLDYVVKAIQIITAPILIVAFLFFGVGSALMYLWMLPAKEEFRKPKAPASIL